MTLSSDDKNERLCCLWNRQYPTVQATTNLSRLSSLIWVEVEELCCKSCVSYIDAIILIQCDNEVKHGNAKELLLKHLDQYKPR